MTRIVRIERLCEAYGCGRRATHVLLEENGEILGHFCEADAKSEKKRVDQEAAWK